MIHHRDVASYGPVNSEAGRRTYQIYCNIVSAARNSTEVIVDNVFTSLHAVTQDWQIDNSEEVVYKEYYADSNVTSGNYIISLEEQIPEGMKILNNNGVETKEFKLGEHFKILIPMSSLEESGSFKINAIAKLDTKPVMFGTTTIPGTQDYALTGFMYEEVGSSIEENYLENTTKIMLFKTDEESGEALENVKFDIENEEEEKLYTDLVTDQDGKIIIEKLLPGKYFIREMQTLDGYEINTEVYEVEIEYGEEKEVTITNKKIVIPEPIKEITPEAGLPPEVISEKPKILPRTGY